MKLTEQDYILGMWFAVDSDNNNFLMTVKRKQNDPLNWEGEYRFRYKVDDKVFNSQDRKSFYNFSIPNHTEEQVLAKLNVLFEAVCIQYNKLSEYTEVKGDLKKFQYRVAQNEYTHFDTVDTEEYKQRGRL